MIIIFYTYLIPRFNWERERRGFNNFLLHIGGNTALLAAQVNHVGRQQKE